MRYKIKPLASIVKPLHNKLVNLIEETQVNPPSGKPYIMVRAKLDQPTDVGGTIILENIYLPIECLEAI